MGSVVEGITEGLTNADCLAAEPVREMADRIVLDHVAADHAGAGRESVAHHIGDELRPALAPQVFGYHRAVGVTHELADLFGAVGDAAMDLADPAHRVV